MKFVLKLLLGLSLLLTGQQLSAQMATTCQTSKAVAKTDCNPKDCASPEDCVLCCQKESVSVSQCKPAPQTMSCNTSKVKQVGLLSAAASPSCSQQAKKSDFAQLMDKILPGMSFMKSKSTLAEQK